MLYINNIILKKCCLCATLFAILKLHFMHPNGHALSHPLFKSQAEGAVAVEAVVACQLLHDDGLSVRDCLAIELQLNTGDERSHC